MKMRKNEKPLWVSEYRPEHHRFARTQSWWSRQCEWESEPTNWLLWAVDFAKGFFTVAAIACIWWTLERVWG